MVEGKLKGDGNKIIRNRKHCFIYLITAVCDILLQTPSMCVAISGFVMYHHSDTSFLHEPSSSPISTSSWIEFFPINSCKLDSFDSRQ